MDAGNTLVERTRIQLLLTLDRYNEALSACSGQSNGSFEHGYALYKLGRHTEALKIIENLNTAGDDRATKVLEAQVVRVSGSLIGHPKIQVALISF